MTNNINSKLNRYLNKQMTDEELSAFEKDIADNDFLADALEGYKRSEASPEDLDIIKPEIITGEKVKLRTYLLWASLAAGITIIFVYFFLLENKPLQKSGYSLSKSILDLNINYDLMDNTDSLMILPDQQNIRKAYISELKTIPEKVIVPESIPPLHINKTIDFDYPTNNKSMINPYTFKSNHHYTYIANYKVVDYRYDKRVNTKIIEIPSNFNFYEISSNNLADNESNFTYNDFLKDALIKIENKHYSEAIENFDIILSQYPNDANACY